MIINKQSTNTAGFRNLVIAVIVFFLVWSINELSININNPLLAGLTKVLVWIVAPYLYLKYVDKVEPWSYMKLANFGKGLKWAILPSLIYFIGATAYFTFIDSRTPDFSLSWGTWLNGIILVGLTEEITFRGFLLHRLSEYFDFWKANIIQAILFVLIHVPIWIALPGDYHLSGTVGEYLFSIVFIFIFAILMGWLVRKTNSLWTAIFIHSTVDYNSNIFLGEISNN